MISIHVPFNRGYNIMVCWGKNLTHTLFINFVIWTWDYLARQSFGGFQHPVCNPYSSCKYCWFLYSLTKFIFFLQGVKTEVESLVEEASSSLISVAQSMVSDIAKLAVLTDFPIPDVSQLKPGGILFNKFSDGIRNGLDQLVKSTCEDISGVKVTLTGLSAPGNM